MILRFLAVAGFILAFAPSTQAGPQDTTAAPKDTVAQKDTVRITFLPELGLLTGDKDTNQFYAGRFLWTDAMTLPDLFRVLPGIFAYDPDSPGLPVHLALGASDWRGLAMFLDGRPLPNPVNGVVNLYSIPLEFIDHLELVTDPGSIAYGANATAAVLNIVSRQYNTARPITKVRFVQGPNEHLLTDALYSQNVLRSLNLMVGVQRHTSEDRYVNSAYDSWIIRSRLRFNPSDRINLSLTDFYERSVTGMNNGIDVDSTRRLGLDIFNEAEAIVLSRQSSETISRRDVALSAAARITRDSTFLSHASLFFSTGDRDYQDNGGLTSTPLDSYSWEVIGASVRQTLVRGFFRIQAGISFERHLADFPGIADHIRRDVLAWAAGLKLRFSVLSPSLFGRGEKNGTGRALSYGAGLALELPFLRLNGSVGELYRFPSLQELQWPFGYQFTGPGPPDLRERHRIATLTARFIPSTSLAISATATERSVKNALAFVPGQPDAKFPQYEIEIADGLKIRQISGDVTMQWAGFEVRGGATWTETLKGSTRTRQHPPLVLTGQIAYRDRFFRDALDARFGIRGRFVERYQGFRYIPALAVFAEHSGEPMHSFSTLDVFGVFRIGDAFVNLSWNNPLDRRFFTVYRYPAQTRNVVFSVNWVFLD